jgi:hypothetical protein
MATSNETERLAGLVWGALQRAKRNTKKPLHATRYANLLNDLLQRETPRRNPVGDLVGMMAGFRELDLSRADAMEVKDAFSYVIDELWEEGNAPVCPRIAHISEETAELSREAAELLLIHYPSPHHAIAYLSEDRKYEEEKKPLRRYAESILNGSAA